MVKYKIIQARGKCIGCGACVAVCSDNWFMDKDGKAKPKKTEITNREYKCNKEAADSCPVQCIEIKEVE